MIFSLCDENISKFFDYKIGFYPAATYCQNDVVLTSIRRDDVAMTPIRRHFDVMMCLLCPFRNSLKTLDPYVNVFGSVLEKKTQSNYEFTILIYTALNCFKRNPVL